MYKLVVLYRAGFETLIFREQANCNHRFDQLRDQKPKRHGNEVLALFMYGPDDVLLVATATRT